MPKTLRVEGIRHCPFDDYEPVLIMNSGKRFKITCPHCEITTAWGSKTQAIISWYNVCEDVAKTLTEARQGLL